MHGPSQPGKSGRAGQPSFADAGPAAESRRFRPFALRWAQLRTPTFCPRLYAGRLANSAAPSIGPLRLPIPLPLVSEPAVVSAVVRQRELFSLRTSSVRATRSD